MRNLFTLAIAFVSCIILLSCNTQPTEKQEKTVLEGNGTKHKVNFVAQWRNEGKRELLMHEFVREYEFLNQQVDVHMEFPEDIGYDKHSALESQIFNAKQITSKSPEWDVVMINGDYEGLSAYLKDPDWAKKYLVDFSQYPQFVQQVSDKVKYEEEKKRWGGIIPGPYLEGSFWALWFNKQVADKIGIEVKQYGMTFADFVSYVKAANAYNSSNDDKVIIFQEAGNWPTMGSVVAHLYISQFENAEDVFAQNITLDKLKAWERTLKALEQLAGLEVLNPNWKSETWSEVNLDLLNQKCLFFANGSWMYNIWLEQNPELLNDCMPAEFPEIGDAQVYLAGYIAMWGVPKNSPNKDQAVEFLLAMNQSGMAEKWVRYTKCPTGIKGNMSNISFGSDQFEDFSYNIQKSYGKNTYVQTEVNALLFGAHYTNEPAYYLEVIQGELSANEAMQLIYENTAVKDAGISQPL